MLLPAYIASTDNSNLSLIWRLYTAPTKEISENIYLYFQIDDNKILKYFACTGFELPELKVENIDHIRVEFIDYTENKPNIIKERSIIESIINNPIDYFANNQISDIYITYKNYNLEEWFDIQKLT